MIGGSASSRGDHVRRAKLNCQAASAASCSRQSGRGATAGAEGGGRVRGPTGEVRPF